MKVRELIALLSALPEDQKEMTVIYDDAEWGHKNITAVCPIGADTYIRTVKAGTTVIELIGD